MTLVPTAEEIVLGALAIHSDVWENRSGSGPAWYWSAEHPSGWSSSGWAPNPDAAWEAIEAQVTNALAENGYGVEPGGVRIVRTHFEG